MQGCIVVSEGDISQILQSLLFVATSQQKTGLNGDSTPTKGSGSLFLFLTAMWTGITADLPVCI